MIPSQESPGPRLRRERERRGLSAQKAADDMHLDVWVIEGLETDQYERVGPPVYAKGHLKKYASLLGLPVDDIVASYLALATGSAASAAPPSIRLPIFAPAIHNLPWTRIGTSAGILLLLGGVIWWKPWHRATAVAAISQQTSAPAIDPGQAIALTTTSGAAVQESSPLPTSGENAAAAGTGTGVSAGTARLRMSFSADSWVTVRDAAGRRIYAGYGHANSVKVIVGKAPMHVYLGYASGVQLEINEHAVAIGLQFVNGDVAHFQVGAEGVLRRDSSNAHPRG